MCGSRPRLQADLPSSHALLYSNLSLDLDKVCGETDSEALSAFSEKEMDLGLYIQQIIMLNVDSGLHKWVLRGESE